MIVIGAGHAGIEAAHAAATLGARTAVFTMSLDAIGNMPCNPSIGGTAKGTLVRELDALGGVMGLAADATYLQSRMLNKGKGPAVHALRVQTDRKRYHEYMKHALELTPGLAIHQAEVVGIEVENGRVKGIVTQLNGEYTAKCVVLATGTNLGGKIFVGDAWYASGPDGMHAANGLTESLKAAGLPLRRFKTGTPARVHRRSIDFSRLECQPGDPDNELQPFSFMTDAPMHNKVECWIAYTNPETHKIILDNIQRSPLYGGMIEGVGPRYCPSIEDKVVRFAGKDRHPIFVEPCGENTEEMYLQGASSSLPEDVQNAFYRSIKGFEHIEILRPAYAIEYDCVDPTSLEATLESKVVRGLYGAGQFNGSTLEFLKGMNAGLQQRHPTAILIAEDSTSFPKVTAPVEYGGLGFDYKWDLGWMNDTLDYFKKTPEERKSNLGKLTFSMMYFWREHYILPFSHDENVHGKATILQKMYGEYEDKFPQGRALYLYMAIHPGKMLDFMGNEFGQLREYDESREQDWLLLDYPIHEAFANYRRTLNELYRKYDAFWSGEYNPDHFLWLDCDHPELDACAILRKGQEATVFAAFNFGDTELKDYELTLPGKGKITPLLNSDWNCFGGRTARPKALRSKTTTGSVKLTLAPYSAQLYRFEPAVEKETK